MDIWELWSYYTPFLYFASRVIYLQQMLMSQKIQSDICLCMYLIYGLYKHYVLVVVSPSCGSIAVCFTQLLVVVSPSCWLLFHLAVVSKLVLRNRVVPIKVQFECQIISSKHNRVVVHFTHHRYILWFYGVFIFDICGSMVQ